MTRTFQLHFLGCKANQSDALSYAGVLQRAGWTETPEGEIPSLLLVQSCTVTMSADAQGRGMVRSLKRQHPEARIVLTGCYAERLDHQEGRTGYSSSIPEADYVIGNLNPRKFELLSEIAGTVVNEDFPDFIFPAETSRTRPYLKIQDGCDARCSYCIIPSVRGNSRSLPVDEVMRRARHFTNLGYKEMILTGISMGGYGKDLTPKTSLSALMERLDAMPGEFKIRLSSVEPEEIDDAFIEVFSNSKRFQPHLHLPLQSASDKVLKKMRRQYLFERYDSIIQRIFARINGLNLGTDILVGFPDEDHESFCRTRDYLKQAPFAYAHVFPFSPRPETPAASFRSLTSNREVKKRAAELRTIANTKNLSYRKGFLGKELQALILKGTEDALTENYIRVNVSQAKPFDGFVRLRIDEVTSEKTFGTLLQ